VLREADISRDLRVGPSGRSGFKYPVTPTEMKICMLEYAKGAAPADAARKSGVPLLVFNLYREQDNFSGDLRKVLKGLVADVYSPKAFAFLHECVIDKEMPARVRVDAAKAILDRSGYTAAPLPAERDPGDITQLTGPEIHKLVGELEARINEAQAKLAAEARDATPQADEDDEGGEADEGAPLGA
jgi:hypothetical protein